MLRVQVLALLLSLGISELFEQPSCLQRARRSRANNRRNAERSSSCRCRFTCIDPDTRRCATAGDLRRDRGAEIQIRRDEKQPSATLSITSVCSLQACCRVSRTTVKSKK